MGKLALRRFYAPEFLVKPALWKGEIPTTKEAYSTTYETAWASIAETFLITLISMADTVMVGRVGAHAIAAVGLVTQPRFLVLTLTMALNIAVTAIVARRKGQNDSDGAIACLRQSLFLSLILSALPAMVAFTLRTPVLQFMGAQADTLELSRQYLEIIMLGTPLNAISMTISAAQRGIGQTRVSMTINMSANIVNLFFNYLLIGGNWGFPQLGVRGAAIATVIGWAFGAVLAILSILHRQGFLYLLSRDVAWKPDQRTLRSMFQVASGSFVEQVCMRVGFITYTRIVADLGTVLFAAHQIFINILNLSFSLGDGFGVASSALVGQTLGARRPDLSILYGKVCQRMSFLCNIVVFLLFIFAGRYMVMLFTDEQAIIELSKPIMYLMGIIMFGESSQMIYMGSLRGAGDTRYTAVISIISVMLLRPLAAQFMVFRLGWGLIGAWLAMGLDQYVRLVLTERRFSSGKWMKIEL